MTQPQKRDMKQYEPWLTMAYCVMDPIFFYGFSHQFHGFRWAPDRKTHWLESDASATRIPQTIGPGPKRGEMGELPMTMHKLPMPAVKIFFTSKRPIE